MIFKNEYPDKPNRPAPVKNLVWDLTRIGFRFSCELDGEIVMTEKEDNFLIRIQAEKEPGSSGTVRCSLMEIDGDNELSHIEFLSGSQTWVGKGRNGKPFPGRALPDFLNEVDYCISNPERLPVSESKRNRILKNVLRELGWEGNDSFSKTIDAGPAYFFLYISAWDFKDKFTLHCAASFGAWMEDGKEKRQLRIEFKDDFGILGSDVERCAKVLREGMYEATLMRRILFAQARAFLSALKALKPEMVQRLGRNRRRAYFEDGRHIAYHFTEKGMTWAASDRKNLLASSVLKTWVPENFDGWHSVQ